jgi:hypothetical protein
MLLKAPKKMQTQKTIQEDQILKSSRLSAQRARMVSCKVD